MLGVTRKGRVKRGLQRDSSGLETKLERWGRDGLDIWWHNGVNGQKMELPRETKRGRPPKKTKKVHGCVHSLTEEDAGIVWDGWPTATTPKWKLNILSRWKHPLCTTILWLIEIARLGFMGLIRVESMTSRITKELVLDYPHTQKKARLAFLDYFFYSGTRFPKIPFRGS